MRSKPSAYIQTIASGNHDVEQKQRRWMPLGIRDDVCGRVKHPDCKSGGLKMMLHQPRNVRFVFEQKYGLAQPNRLSPAAVLDFLGSEDASGHPESLTD